MPEDGVTFVRSEGGVVITLRNGLYGAMTRKGKEIVKNEYEKYVTAPNGDGQFVLGNGDTLYCFDADGTMVHKIKNGLKVKINEDYIVATYLKVYADGSYSIQLDTYDIRTESGMSWETIDAYVLEFTPVVDGKYYVTWMGQYGVTIVQIDRETNKSKEICQEPQALLFTPNGNYGSVYALNQQQSGFWLGLMSTDGTKDYRIQINELMDLYGIPKKNWGFDALRHTDYGEGIEYCNIGTQVVITVNSENGARTDYFLVDFEKAETRKRSVQIQIMGGYTTMDVNVVDNLEEVVLGHYEYIGQYGNGLYPVMKDGRCFYIDTKGKRVSEKDYETALWYLDGFAMATDGDKAYILDVDGNEWSVEDYGVDDFNERKGIGMGGDAFCLEEDGKVVYLYVTEK